MQVGDHNGITLCWASEERDRARDCGCGIAYDHVRGFSDDVHVVGNLVDVVRHDRVDDDNDVQPDTRGLRDGDRSICRVRRYRGVDGVDELVWNSGVIYMHKSEDVRSETHRRIDVEMVTTLCHYILGRHVEVISAHWQTPVSLTGTPRRAPAS